MGDAQIGEGSRRGPRLRGAARAIVIVVALAATIATSPPEEDISVRQDGPRVELSIDRPEAAIQAAVRPNAEAAGAGRIRVFVRVTPLWAGSVPEGDALEVEALDSTGQVLGVLQGDYVWCEGEACLDLDEIRFRLVDPAGTSVVVNWSLDVELYYGPGEVPDESRVELQFAAQDPGVTEVKASGMLAAFSAGARYTIAANRIQIYAPDGIPPESEIHFEPLHVRETAVLHEEHRSHPVEELVAIPISPPARCWEGECDWSLLLVADQIEWQLVAAREVELQIGVAEVSPAELVSEPVVGAPIEIEKDERVRLVTVVEVDRDLVSGHDFDFLDPFVRVDFDLILTADDPEARVFINPDGHRGGVWQMDLDCDELTCRASTEWVMAIPLGRTGTVDWEARAYIPFFVTREVPAGATIRFEVSR